MMGIFALADEGKFGLDSPVPVRNRFFSLANGEPFSVPQSRDGCPLLYASLGEKLPVSELAYHMIVTSSNLATNLLIDMAGIDALQEQLDRLGVRGVELRRGVEDELAWAQGINNRITANGLLQLFRLLHSAQGMAPEICSKMLDILFDQEIRQGIPAGIPADLRGETRIAHKTGEISTVEHDAGLVCLPGRKPYALAILTERVPGESHSKRAIQRLSRLVYRRAVRMGPGDA
jgi:beta-lactamase class A